MARDFARRAAPVNRHWTTFAENNLGQAAGSVAKTNLAAQHDRETILRTRGNLFAQLDGVNAPGAAGLVTVGMILVPEGTGVTVLWSPFIDGDAPWFWHESFVLAYEEAVVDAVAYSGGGTFRTVIDSKAMRRVRNQEIQMVVENTTIQSAIEVNLSIAGRFLSQE